MVASDSGKYLASPNYPGDYDSSRTCQWRISPTYEAYYIQLRFISFNVETCCDKFTILDNGEVRWIKHASLNDFYTAEVTGDIVVRFSTDGAVNRDGFMLEYNQVWIWCFTLWEKVFLFLHPHCLALEEEKVKEEEEERERDR